MKYKFFLLITLIFIITGCAIQDWSKAISNTDKINPNWDVNINIPIYEKTIVLSDYFDGFTIAPFTNSTAISGLALWPTPLDVNGNIMQTIPVNTVMNQVDFSGDGLADFDLYGIHSTDARLSVRISLIDSALTSLPLLSSEISITSMVIEGVTYNFGAPVDDGGVLVFTSTNFLDPANNYYLNFAGGDGDYTDLDITSFTVTAIGNAIPRYSGPETYTLNIDVGFEAGADLGIVGRINADVPIISLIAIPLDMSSLSGNIENFKFNYSFYSDLPFDIQLDQIFYGSNAVPVPNAYSILINSGVMITDPINGYNYTSLPFETSDEVLFSGNMSSYGALSMDYNVILPASTQDIMITNNGTISIKMSVSADVNINL